MSTPTTAALYRTVLVVAAAVVALDQITKSWALSALADGPIHLIDGALSLRLTYNQGGAFGILSGVPNFFLVATVLVVVVILVWARKLESHAWAAPLGSVLGGGIGNLLDRIFRDTDGAVVDFVDLHVWPVFNVADSAIVLGVVVILVLTARAETQGRSSGDEEVEPSRSSDA